MSCYFHAVARLTELLVPDRYIFKDGSFDAAGNPYLEAAGF
jgi:hypothetical protein